MGGVKDVKKFIFCFERWELMDNVFKKRGNMGYGKANLLFTLARAFL